MSENIIKGLPQGAVLQGKSYQYKIVRALGQGSFGITYLATMRVPGALGELDLNVAVKEFFMRDINGRTGTSVTSGSENGLFVDYRKKFVREARNLSRLRHPNIVKVLEAFETNGTVYYAMDYISGGSLDDHIAQRGRLQEEECVKYAREICSALGFMHKNGMLHLDLKPLNIMLRDGHAVLIDFGLSKQYDENGEPESSTMVGKGTKGYAPLEQSDYQEGQGFPVTMDIYALGGTMFKMLSGQRPPDASHILNQGFPAAELQGKGVSQWLIELVKKCMAPMMVDRPQSAAEVLEVLNRHAPTGEETMLGGDEPIVAEVVSDIPEGVVSEPEAETVETKPAEPVQPTPKPKGKSLLSPVTIAVACLVAIGIVAAAVLLRKPKPSDGELARVDTVYVDTVAIPDRLTSQVIAPDEEETQEPEKKREEEVAAPAPQQQTQSEQQTQTTTQATQTTQTTQTTTTATQTSKPTSGYINGHEYVDLGLSVKWATCNVGASSPSEYGNYYAWGETSTKSSYDEDNSRTYNVSMGSIAGDPSYDAACSNWGGTWRLPTANEIDELINKCQRTWTTVGGHAGYKVTGPNGNSIFLPAAGWRNGTSLCYAGGSGYYWSAAPDESSTQNAYNLNFSSGYFRRNDSRRDGGFSVRAVSE
ncbi:MAG: protein kinase [Prevotellaceae bacterium]|nr:protein kinase [Prevotellaceae bacterium]